MRHAHPRPASLFLGYLKALSKMSSQGCSNYCSNPCSTMHRHTLFYSWQWFDVQGVVLRMYSMSHRWIACLRCYQIVGATLRVGILEPYLPIVKIIHFLGIKTLQIFAIPVAGGASRGMALFAGITIKWSLTSSGTCMYALWSLRRKNRSNMINWREFTWNDLYFGTDCDALCVCCLTGSAGGR